MRPPAGTSPHNSLHGRTRTCNPETPPNDFSSAVQNVFHRCKHRCCSDLYMSQCRHVIHMARGGGGTGCASACRAHSHGIVIMVRRPSSVGRLPVTRLPLRSLQQERRAKQLGVLSVFLAHFTLGLQISIGKRTELQNE